MFGRSRKRLRVLAAAAAAALCAVGCSSKSESLPADPQLESYMSISARCAFVDRSFSDDPELRAEEMAAVNLPEDWKARVDSLVTRHGAGARFWYRVYAEILDRSRG